jgi:hypothetical protein
MPTEPPPYSIRQTDSFGESFHYSDDVGHLTVEFGYAGPPPQIICFDDVATLEPNGAVTPERLIDVLTRIRKGFPGAQVLFRHGTNALPILDDLQARAAIKIHPKVDPYPNWMHVEFVVR